MKSNKKIIIIISILIVLIAGISCIIIFKPNKGDINDIKESNNTDDKTPSENDTNEIQYLCKGDDDNGNPESCASYIRRILIHKDDGGFETFGVKYSKEEYEKLSSKIDDINISNLETLACQYDNLGKNKMLSSDISIDTKLEIAIIKYLNDNVDNIKELYVGQKIKESEIIEIINTIFSDKISSLDGINDTEGRIFCKFSYEYSKDEKVITITEDIAYCGGIVDYVGGFDSKLEETSDGINVYVRFLHGSYSDEISNFKAYSCSIKDESNCIGNLEFDYKNNYKEILNGKPFDSNSYNLLKQYKFVFKSDNGKYLFESVEKVN